MKNGSLLIAMLLGAFGMCAQGTVRTGASASTARIQTPTPVSADSIIALSSALGMDQVQSILDNYFTTKTKPNGTTVYEPITVMMEMERLVLVPKKDGSADEKTETFAFYVPLITMAPIQTVAIDEVKIRPNGTAETTLKPSPLPKGLVTIIEAYSNSIQPVTVSSKASGN